MRAASMVSYLALLRVGFTLPRTVTSRAVRSYRTFSPLPSAKAKGGIFSVALSLRSPPPDVIRHRVSMEPGLSSPHHLSTLQRATIQPAGLSNWPQIDQWSKGKCNRRGRCSDLAHDSFYTLAVMAADAVHLFSAVARIVFENRAACRAATMPVRPSIRPRTVTSSR